MLARLPKLVNENQALVHRGRFLSTRFLIGVGTTDWLVKVAGGRIVKVTEGPHLMEPWEFSIRASENAWRSFWKPTPKPGFHDIFAMTKSGEAIIEGNIKPFMQNLRYVKEVLEALRG